MPLLSVVVVVLTLFIMKHAKRSYAVRLSAYKYSEFKQPCCSQLYPQAAVRDVTDRRKRRPLTCFSANTIQCSTGIDLPSAPGVKQTE